MLKNSSLYNAAEFPTFIAVQVAPPSVERRVLPEVVVTTINVSFGVHTSYNAVVTPDATAVQVSPASVVLTSKPDVPAA